MMSDLLIGFIIFLAGVILFEWAYINNSVDVEDIKGRIADFTFSIGFGFIMLGVSLLFSYFDLLAFDWSVPNLVIFLIGFAFAFGLCWFIFWNNDIYSGLKNFIIGVGAGSLVVSISYVLLYI